jgi:aryl-phospho-beta-D-glucosidase BglC (GH1 family)
MKLFKPLGRNKVMKSMSATLSTQTTWLRTDHPVIPVNPAAWNYLPEVEIALHRGVEATADIHRPGFYEIEIGEIWYYVHVPNRLRAVYLVAAQNRVAARRSGL